MLDNGGFIYHHMQQTKSASQCSNMISYIAWLIFAKNRWRRWRPCFFIRDWAWHSGAGTTPCPPIRAGWLGSGAKMKARGAIHPSPMVPPPQEVDLSPCGAHHTEKDVKVMGPPPLLRFRGNVSDWKKWIMALFHVTQSEPPIRSCSKQHGAVRVGAAY